MPVGTIAYSDRSQSERPVERKFARLLIALSNHNVPAEVIEGGERSIGPAWTRNRSLSAITGCPIPVTG
jgi:hypothetical protein